MSISFKDNPDLIESELKSLRDHGLRPKVIEHEDYSNRVVIDCSVPNGVFGNDTGESLNLEIIFPDNFPFFRPQVLAKNLHLPRHQNPLHLDLCLLPKETLNWDIQTIGSFLKNRLPKVLKEGVETDPDVIAATPNEQAEPVSEYYTGMNTLVFTSGLPVIMEEPITMRSPELKILDSGTLQIETKQNSSDLELNKISGPGLVINISKWIDRNGDTIQSDFKSYFSAEKTKCLRWFKLSKFPSEIYGDNFLTQFKNLIKRDKAMDMTSLQLRTKDYNLLSSFCILFPEEDAPGKMGWVGCNLQ